MLKNTDFICDICGKLAFTEYTHGCPYSQLLSDFDVNVDYDLCRECTKKVVEFIKSIQEG